MKRIRITKDVNKMIRNSLEPKRRSLPFAELPPSASVPNMKLAATLAGLSPEAVERVGTMSKSERAAVYSQLKANGLGYRKGESGLINKATQQAAERMIMGEPETEDEW